MAGIGGKVQRPVRGGKRDAPMGNKNAAGRRKGKRSEGEVYEAWGSDGKRHKVWIPRGVVR